MSTRTTRSASLSALLLVLFGGLSACGGGAGGRGDSDGDGFTTADDCDDNDSSAYPGAAELCDAVDNDCDGEADEGLMTSWYVDADADGYGDRDSAPVSACADPGGHANAGGDCNDSSDEVFPGAPEQCNTVDDNCDGATDDGVGEPYYVDADGDGYGVPGDAVWSCDGAPAGMAATDTDCDDSDSSRNPGQVETCGDLDDDDCDGIADVGPEGVWHSDDDGDGYGHPGVSETTCEPQDGWVQDDSDCRPSDSAAYPGAVETCNEIDDNCDGVVDDGMDLDADGYRNESCSDGTDCDDSDATIHPDVEIDTCGDGIDQDCSGRDRACGFDTEVSLNSADAHVYGTNASWYLSLLTDIGDPTGDGINDVVSASYAIKSYGGGGYIVPGPMSGVAAYEDVGHLVSGTYATTYGAGRSFGIGDVNGDGVDDVGFGAPYGNNAGMYIEYGPITGDRDLSDPDLYLSCQSGIYCGHGGDIGDFTGDGIDDAIVGAWGASGGGYGTGAAYLMAGPLTADASLLTDAHAIDGASASTYAGRFIYVGGDVNADGIGDMLVAAPWATGSAPTSGVVYVVHGPGTHITDMGSADATLLGPGYAGYLGEGRPMCAQDVNGDGYADPAVGSATTAAGSAAGGAYLMFGPVSGDVDLRSADVTVEGASTRSGAGSSVAMGDIDGDGSYELLVGADGDSTGSTGGGAAFLFTDVAAGTYTTADADTWFNGDVANAYAGTSSFMGDLNDDGRDDVAIGAYNDGTGARGAGGVFVQFAGE